VQGKLFFSISQNLAPRLTEIFDFVWPTAAAIWNLRWQVAGLLSVLPDLTEEDLLGRFVVGSDITGANLRRACTKTTWADQQQEFARFLLFEFCALYEAWCEGCLKELGASAELSKDLQYPTTTKDAKKRGVGLAIDTINRSTSDVLCAAIYPTIGVNRKKSRPHLEQLLVCYRYFKEVRNSLIHVGGSQSNRLAEAEAGYKALGNAALGVAEVPRFNPQTPGKRVRLDLRGVVGFGEIVLRLMCTLDIELSQAKDCERVFVTKWRSTHGNRPVTIASRPDPRMRRIKSLVKQLGLPKPIVSPQFEAWLRSEQLIS
jgi:hypothetical protein